MEAALRARLTTDEYQAVILQLEGALEAVDLLARRAPDFVRYFFTGLSPIDDARLMLPDQAKHAIEALVLELRAVHEEPAPPRRQPLHLVWPA